MLPYAEDLSEINIHVQAPTAVVFVCGGPFSDKSIRIPLSLRDAFLKGSDDPALENQQIILAEKVTKLSVFRDHYSDLLEFETDIAQVTELILLFCESVGSFAELGAFSMLSEIAKRLMVIILDKHWNDDSFVKLGPLNLLQRIYGEETVFVISDRQIGIDGKSIADVKIDILWDRLRPPLLARFKKPPEPTTFDQTKAGHLIKLAVGLIQEYGALTLDETIELLQGLKVNHPPGRIAAYLLCAEAVGWIIKKRIGYSTFYFALNLRDAATLRTKDSAKVRQKARRRLLIREHWEKTDEPRDSGIKEVFGGGKL